MEIKHQTLEGKVMSKAAAGETQTTKYDEFNQSSIENCGGSECFNSLAQLNNLTPEEMLAELDRIDDEEIAAILEERKSLPSVPLEEIAALYGIDLETF